MNIAVLLNVSCLTVWWARFVMHWQCHNIPSLCVLFCFILFHPVIPVLIILLALLCPVCCGAVPLAMLCAAGGCVLVAQCAVSCVGDSGMKISTSCVTPAQPWTTIHPAGSTCCWLTWSIRTRSSSNAPWLAWRTRTGLLLGNHKGSLNILLSSFMHNTY